MVSTAFLAFLGMASAADMWQPLVEQSSGSLGNAASMPYSRGDTLYHDNFSPYDYNYHQERKHRILHQADVAYAQKRIQWESEEKERANFAWNQKKQNLNQLPNGPTNSNSMSIRTPEALIHYAAPLEFPDSFESHGLQITPVAPPEHIPETWGPGAPCGQ